MAADELIVHGAREHNLKDIDVRLPGDSPGAGRARAQQPPVEERASGRDRPAGRPLQDPRVAWQQAIEWSWIDMLFPSTQLHSNTCSIEADAVS